MKREDIPNIITILRLCLIVPIVIALLQLEYRWAFGLFVIAGLSDALDGFLARHYHWMSRFGAIVDPFADKLLMLVTYLALAWLGDVPFWLFALIVGRDLLIMIGVIIYRYYVEKPQFFASFLSKINTFLQIFLVLVVLFHQGFIPLPESFRLGVMYLVVFTTIASFLDYALMWGWRALRLRQNA